MPDEGKAGICIPRFVALFVAGLVGLALVFGTLLYAIPSTRCGLFSGGQLVDVREGSATRNVCLGLVP
jgi:hypothetical protein